MSKLKYTDGHRLWAYQMYLEGKSLSDIAHLLSQTIGDTVALSTVHRWKKIGNWDAAKQDVQLAVVKQVERKEIVDQAQRLNEALGDYSKIKVKARKVLEEESGVDFEEASDAAKALHMSIQGERKIHADLLAKAFVDALLSAVQEHIQDYETLQRIGTSFKRVWKEYERVSTL